MSRKGNLLTLAGIKAERAEAQQLRPEALLDLSESPAVSKQPKLSRNSLMSACVKVRRWEMARSEGPISPNPFIPPCTENRSLGCIHVHLAHIRELPLLSIVARD